MATYREIKGLRVPYLDADLPSASASTQEGQVWYNSSTGKLRAFVSYDTWATGGTMNTGRDYMAGFGLQTAAIAAAGYIGTSVSALVEEYNGSGWSETTDVNTARRIPEGNGTSTAGLIVGGLHTATVGITEEFNGSTWSEKGDLNTVRRSMGSAMQGTTEAALVFGGDPPSTLDVCESFNGTSWTEVGDLNTAREKSSGFGTQTAALCVAGSPNGSATGAVVESWDNSSWTEVGDINTARFDGAGGGSSTAAVFFGGTPPDKANTELWDGSSWTETTDMSTARSMLGGAGAIPAALGFGGSPPADTTQTEEFNKSILTYTPAAWASGGNLPNPASTHTAFGPGTAGIHAGGELSGGANAEAFHYDGSAWTAGGNLATPRNLLSGYGTQTAGGVVGGDVAPGLQDVHETYDGSSWTEAGDLNTARSNAAGASSGTTTAALYAGGNTGSATNASEEYNGTSWAEGDNLNTARLDCSGAGTQTAGLCISGNTESPDAVKTEVESYNGTSWSEVGDVNTAVDRSGSMAGGTQDIAIKVGGRDGTGDPNPTTANVEQWDGTSWVEIANINTARFHGAVGSSPTTSSAFLSGGTPPATNATEEYTGETTAAEASDIDFD